MTRAVGDDQAMMNSLQEVVTLFKEAQNSVFKLMSSVRHPHHPHACLVGRIVLTCIAGLRTQVLKRTEVLRHDLTAQLRPYTKPPQRAIADAARAVKKQSRPRHPGVSTFTWPLNFSYFLVAQFSERCFSGLVLTITLCHPAAL